MYIDVNPKISIHINTSCRNTRLSCRVSTYLSFVIISQGKLGKLATLLHVCSNCKKKNHTCKVGSAVHSNSLFFLLLYLCLVVSSHILRYRIECLNLADVEWSTDDRAICGLGPGIHFSFRNGWDSILEYNVHVLSSEISCSVLRPRKR